MEDEARIAAFVVKGLRKGGHQVESVATGRGALERAVRTPSSYDLLLLDLGLPDLDGLEVLAELRRACVHTPVMVVTARLAPEEQQRAMDLGATDYLLKPFAFRELLARMEQLGPAAASA